jgi:hypothetical protein
VKSTVQIVIFFVAKYPASTLAPVTESVSTQSVSVTLDSGE